ncbi:MAG: Lipopolysaccharide heptosyltransferase 1 [Chlamydiia bacterium]|nr:Lipopolysaccharide heptosyltransferase 1 [Chlamydiia bacterium]
MRILLVKLSSLGDIIQTFDASRALVESFPNCRLDWAVEKSYLPLIQSLPWVDRAIPFSFGALKKNRYLRWGEVVCQLKELRKVGYDRVYDLQGNSKSGLVTWMAKSRYKVGLGANSVAETPNRLVTNHQYEFPESGGMPARYRAIVERDVGKQVVLKGGMRLALSAKERLEHAELQRGRVGHLMVCPGSRWENKKLSIDQWKGLLAGVEVRLMFIWGSQTEKAEAEALSRMFPGSCVVGGLSLPLWQNVMRDQIGVVCVDSAALHLAAASQVATFSIFGASNPQFYAPLGERHAHFFGDCPFGKQFGKRCGILRTCESGGCMKEICPSALKQSFTRWCASLRELSGKKCDLQSV